MSQGGITLKVGVQEQTARGKVLLSLQLAHNLDQVPEP